MMIEKSHSSEVALYDEHIQTGSHQHSLCRVFGRLMKRIAFAWLFPTSIVAIGLFGYRGGSSFQVLCAICFLAFVGALLRLMPYTDKSESEQKKRCMSTGFLLLFPSLGVIGAGIQLFYRTHSSISPEVDYCTVIIATGLSIWLLLRQRSVWRDGSLAGRFSRLTIGAALSAPLSLVIVIILAVTGTKDASILSCMTTVVFGGAALLIAINMILVSCCGYKSTGDSIRMVHRILKSKKLVFTRVSIVKDVFLVVGKMFISLVSASFFLFANALYTSGMGIARFIALRMHSQPREKQITSYRLVGIIISIASICYVVYSARLFFGGKSGIYSMYIALVIALYTFVEFGINIRDIRRLRKSKALEAKALRAVSFASTLICFVLTQTAIMSFAAEGDNSFSNALSGVVFGTLAAITGVYIIIDSRRQAEIP